MDWFGTAMRPMAGGYSGETFLVGDDPASQVVLRIYRRSPDRASVDASLLDLVRGVIPVPRVVDVRPPVAGRPGVLVTERLEGTRLDLLMATMTAELRAVIGRHLGLILARLSGIAMLRFGMFEGRDLRLSEGQPGDGLLGWTDRLRTQGRLARWRDEDWEALVSLLGQADVELDGGEWRDCELEAGLARRVLVHSDFNPKNILVDPDSWEVTGVLDWEFAHAGSPYADLGNLTRFERHPDFVDAVLGAFTENAPVLAKSPLKLARAADLWALVELAGRVCSNPVGDLATGLLLAQARAADLDAWPWDGPRVDPARANAVS